VIRARLRAGWFLVPACALAGACHGGNGGRSGEHAPEILAVLRANSAWPLQPALAGGFQTVTGGYSPQFSPAGERVSAHVVLPARASGATHLEDTATGVGVDVALANASASAAEISDGYVVYPHGHASGASVIHRALPSGTEDYLSFDVAPAVPEVDYNLALGHGVSGLRLVAGTLEMLDARSAPRLRVAPPYIIGADGSRTDATLAVAGCAVDTNPAAPWGRPVTPPGAPSCAIRVTWPAAAVVYPAVLDPRWTTTGAMTSMRQGHTATLLSTGNVLVVGGTSNGTTALATAELYNRTTGTWAATASMTGARTLHSATQLPASSNTTTGGKVLIAGGLNGTTSQNTAQLYSPTAGTWVAAGTLNAARHGHTATLLVDGRVLVTGGLNGTTTLNTAALYNPGTGSGSWAAAAGTMASALKNHAAALLTTSNAQLSNKVLVFGGNNGTATVSVVYLFDPTQNAFSTQTSLPSVREGHTVTVLANGNLLVTGGKSGTTTLATTVLFNPATGTGSWTSAGTMTAARQAHSATLIPSALVSNGQVLVAGGSSGSATLTSAELWNGTTTWTATSALLSAQQGHTATLLGNDAILIAGGVSGTTTLSTSQLYDASFGLTCTSNTQCVTGFCVSGVCCDTACNGGCGACNLAGKVGTCSAVASGTVCRASAGTCDVAETCSGTSLTCPTDGFQPATTVCRASAGTCDVAEKCSGTSASCPADGFIASGTVCRASAGTCDVAETCSGTSASCPADGFQPSTTVCRASAGACDVAEKCSGTSASCPADGFMASGSVCRASAGTCDVAETCSGTSVSCPADGFQPATTVCRASAGTCDVAEKCSGTSASCPVDGFIASGTVCRASAGTCDVAETCSGTSASCPADGFQPATTVCRASAGTCDVAEKCSGTSASCPADGFMASGSVCRVSAGTCDVAEICSGTSASCPTDAFQPATTVCRASAGICDVAENCSGTSASCPADGFQPATTVCRASAGTCDVAEKCTGTSTSCPADGFLTSGTVCRASAGTCDVAETCSGTSASCPADGFQPSTTVCRPSAGVCDAAESCSGTSASCPADGFLPSSTVCRPSTGVCDAAEDCPGNAATCPADLPAPNGTACNDGNACTRTDTCQGGTCIGGSLITCAAPDQCHLAGTCNTTTGTCSNPTVAPNTPCSDGNACNGTETCDANGVCQPASAIINGGFETIAAPSGGPTIGIAPTNDASYQFVPGPTLPATLLPTAPAQTAILGWTTLLNGVEWGSPILEAQQGLNVSPAGGASIDLAPLTFTGGGIQQTVPTNAGQQYQLSFYGGESAFDGRSGAGEIDVAINGTAFATVSLTGTDPNSINWQLFTYKVVATTTSTVIAFTNNQDPLTHFAILDGVRLDACDASGNCQGAPPATDDGNPCTADACDPVAGVTHTPVANGTVCSGGNPCITGATCQAGTCTGGTTTVCPAPDQCHTGTATCDPATGCAGLVAVANGTACNDGNACTQTDTCQAGACVGGNPIQCAPSDGCHAPSTCDPTLGTCVAGAVLSGSCQLGVFDYDKAGRLIHDRGSLMTYDGYDQLRTVTPNEAGPVPSNIAVEEIGNIDGSFANAFPTARAINAKAHVTGWATLPSGATHTYIYVGSGNSIDVNDAANIQTELDGFGIANDDTVGGGYFDGSGVQHLFTYSQSLGFKDLGVGPAGTMVQPQGMNDQEQFTGSLNLPGGISHGFRFTPGVGYEDIGTLGGQNSFGFGIDDSGTVLSSAQTPSSPNTGFESFGHATIYNTELGLVDLNRYVDPTSSLVLVTSFRSAGNWISGTAIDGGINSAYRLNLSTGMVDDISVNNGGSLFGFGINSYGEIVGDGTIDGATQPSAAYIFTDALGLRKLNDLIDPSSGWNLTNALVIDDEGDVVGTGYLNGRFTAYILRLPLRSSTGGAPTVAVAHSYGYDHLRTSTTNAPGTTGASVQFWFTQDYSQHDGVRDHYVRIGDRIVAKVTYNPPSGGTMGMGPVRRPGEKPTDLSDLFAKFILILILVGGAGVTAAGFVGKKRRPAWVAATAGPVALFFVASCEMLGLNSRQSAATLWQRVQTVFFHQGIASGPVLTTNSAGSLQEERRYEPFGQPIDASVAGTIGDVDFRREEQNSLGKLTDPATGWSYHGMRWMQPQTARWTAPDPEIKGPNVLTFGENPYSYVNQMPTIYWDKAGNYEEPVHGGLTYNLAVDAGFSPDQAAKIALADAGMDHAKATMPVVPGDPWETLKHEADGKNLANHFANYSSEEALKPVQDEIAEGRFMGLQELGKDLHTLEDWGFADASGPHARGIHLGGRVAPTHGLYITETGKVSAPWNHVADKAYNDPKANKKELIEIYGELKAAAKAYGIKAKPNDVAAMKDIDGVIDANIRKGQQDYMSAPPSGDSSAPSYQQQLDSNAASSSPITGVPQYSSPNMDIDQ
jgi:RHS repeat-associated protein